MQWHMPIGYRVKNGKIEIDSEKKKIVKQIFDDYDKGMSTAKIAKDLVERMVENGNGRVSWTHVSVGKILENHNYLGTEYYPQLISNEQFERVQKRREEYRIERGRGIYRPAKQHRLMFSGMLMCAECGGIYSHVQPKDKKRGIAKWKCKNYVYQNKVTCEGGFISDEQLEELCIYAINQLITRPILVTNFAEKAQRVSLQYREIERQLKEPEKLNTDELLRLLLRKAETRYATLEVRDLEIKSKEMEELLSERTEIEEFDEELFRGLIQQIYVYKNNTVKVIFQNNNSLEVGYQEEI